MDKKTKVIFGKSSVWTLTWITSVLILLLSVAANTNNSIKYLIYIPINISMITIIIGFMLLVDTILLIYLNKGNEVFDFTSIVLLVKLLYAALLSVYFGCGTNVSQFFSCIYSFVIYVFFLNTKVDEKIFKNILLCTLILIFVDTAYALSKALLMSLPLSAIKPFIQIPFGGSNFIASLVLCILPILTINNDNKKIEWLSLILGAATIIMARSNTGMAILAIYLILRLFIEFKRNAVRALLIILLVIILGIKFGNTVVNSNYFNRVITAIYNVFSGDRGSVVKALNGRQELYAKAKFLIQKSSIVGYGFVYREYLNGIMAHNWVFEQLLIGGIPNLILFLVLISSTGVDLFKVAYNGKCEYVVSFILVLVDAWFEPSLGTFRFDIIFWMIIAIACNACVNRNGDMEVINTMALKGASCKI